MSHPLRLVGRRTDKGLGALRKAVEKKLVVSLYGDALHSGGADAVAQLLRAAGRSIAIDKRLGAYALGAVMTCALKCNSESMLDECASAAVAWLVACATMSPCSPM